MIRSVTRRPRARVDLLEQFVYFGEEESIELAERYFAAVDETCASLVKQPRIGRFTIPAFRSLQDCCVYQSRDSRTT